MPNLGTLTKKINSSKFQIFIGTPTSNDFILLQNARMLISHAEFREPNNSGEVAFFSGAADHILSGTMLFTTDQWDNSSAFDFGSMLTRTNGEVALNQFVVRVTGADGSINNFTFSNGKLSVLDVSKPVEGGVKADINIVLPSDPTVT